MSDLKATLKTNRGDIVLNLFPDHAPKVMEHRCHQTCADNDGEGKTHAKTSASR